MKKLDNLTQEYLKSILNYDRETGIFTWKKRPAQQIHIGDIAGSKDNKGYIVIMVSRVKYKAHRLAWLYEYGTWPADDIDHKDTIKHHNWISNLREATKGENQQNQVKAKSHNKSTGLLGAFYFKTQNSYYSKIKVDGKQIFLGYFDTAQDAHTAYITAKRELHPFNMI